MERDLKKTGISILPVSEAKQRSCKNRAQTEIIYIERHGFSSDLPAICGLRNCLADKLGVT